MTFPCDTSSNTSSDFFRKRVPGPFGSMYETSDKQKNVKVPGPFGSMYEKRTQTASNDCCII